MRILKLGIMHYRSIENLELAFPAYYTAICGKNDAGKSNIIRVLRLVFTGPDRNYFPVERVVSLKDDFTKWCESEKDDKRFIQFNFQIEIHPHDDAGVYRFLFDYLKLPVTPGQEEKPIDVRIMAKVTGDTSQIQFGVLVAGQPVENLRAEEVLKKIRSSFSVLFHDSTEPAHSFDFLEVNNIFSEMSATETQQINQAKQKLDKVLSRIAKRNQQNLTAVLGRLRDKYKLGISLDRRMEDSEVPYSITLGTDDLDVELERWGSGTQNRTRILMTLFKAKQVRDSAVSASKMTPVIVIEEPESYLHPSAQAEFGLILRDLAEEFRLQVIVTTHSPYLLSLDQPEANILLERKIVKKKVRSTELRDTSGEHWLEPFSLALGISGSELAPWKDAFFTSKDTVLLMEGEVDKDYLTLLLSEDHGESRLKFDWTLFAYGGKDTLKQKQLLRFMISRFKKFLVTFDLDCEAEVEPHLKELSLVRGVDYLAVGRDAPAKRCIEGLLPEGVFQSVYSANVDLVQKATSGNSPEAKSARSELKRLLLAEFKRTARPGSEDYKAFYSLTKQLNRMAAL